MQLTLVSGTVLRCMALCVMIMPAKADSVQSQGELDRRVEDAKPSEYLFIKDLPILGWRLDGASIEDLPEVIRAHLGAVDATGYDAAYLAENRGSIIALQMTGEGPDFYIIGKSTYDSSYEEVSLADVAEKNELLVDRLSALPDLQDLFRQGNPSLVGARKTEPVAMTRMSDIGYVAAGEVTIASPWGTQTKPAGQDAFLVHDGGKDQYYMINVDENGMPIGYVPAE